MCHHVTFLAFRLAPWVFDRNFLSTLSSRWLGLFLHYGIDVERHENGQIFVDIMSIVANEMRVFLLFTHDRLFRSLLRSVHNKVVVLVFVRCFGVLKVQMAILRLRMGPSLVELRLVMDTFD